MKTISLVIAVVTGSFLCAPPGAEAFVTFYLVTKTVDTADGICDSDCSLREAVIASNSSAGPDAIGVPAGYYALTIPGRDEDSAQIGDLDITEDVTIAGEGAASTVIDGNDLDRLFHVVGGTVEINNVAIRNGSTRADPFTGQGGGPAGGIYNESELDLHSVSVSDNISEDDGGGIASLGIISITNSAIAANHAAYGFGGGVHSNGLATITGSSITGNSGSDGGGVLVIGTAVIHDTIISGNVATLLIGGGLDNFGLTVITDATIDGNVAVAGGGIGNQQDTLEISSTTISNNMADFGGGISSGGDATITNVTITGNRATANGGGINYNGSINGMRLTSVTITGNSADAGGQGNGDGGGVYAPQGNPLFSFKNSIVGGNTDGSGEAPDCAGDPASAGYNLVGDVAGCAIAGDMTGNVIGADPLLGALQLNGGPTKTHGLLPGSPAIDAGSPDCPPPGTDQRGVSRPVDGDGDSVTRCDMGAFERRVDEDDDGDGYAGSIEAHVGTDSLDACADTTTPNDERGPAFGEPLSPWPADVNDDTFVDSADIAALTNYFGKPVPPVPARYDIAPDGFIDILGDITRMTGVFGRSCAP